MVMMKLHWSPKSPYVRKVMICAHELGLADRIELVRSVAAMLKPNPRLMEDNPLSKIPTLVLPDGFALFDSAVICEYLNDLAGGSLFPSHGNDKWQALRWHAFGDGLLDAAILWRNERERAQPLQPLIDTLSQGAGSSWYFVHRAPNIVRNAYPAGFRVQLHEKDLRICREMTARHGVQLPLIEMTLLHYRKLIEQGHGDEDISTLFRLKDALFASARDKPASS